MIGDDIGIVRYAGDEGRSQQHDAHEVMGPVLTCVAGTGLRLGWEAVRRRHNVAAAAAATVGCIEATLRGARGDLGEVSGSSVLTTDSTLLFGDSAAYERLWQDGLVSYVATTPTGQSSTGTTLPS